MQPDPSLAVPRAVPWVKIVTVVSLVLCLLGAVSSVLGLFWPVGVANVYRMDTEVYRFGAQAWLDGTSIYNEMPMTRRGVSLPFTYPPIAAVLLIPTTWFSVETASQLVSASSMVAMGAVLALVARSAEIQRLVITGWSRGRWVAVATAAAALAFAIEPFRETVAVQGQVNVLLMLAVVADVCLVRTKWPRGLLIGVVSAFKLTPLVFVILLVAAGRWRAAGTAVLTALGCTALGFLLAPQDSVRYWTELVWGASRIGHPEFSVNQSLTGTFARLALNPKVSVAAWVLTSAVLGLLVWWLVRRATNRGMTVVALSAAALYGLLVSPVSWSHHWVWVVVAVPALLAVAACATPILRQVVVGWVVVGVALFAVGAHWVLPHRFGLELTWNWWQRLLGEGYVWWGVGALLLTAVVLRPSRTLATVDTPAAESATTVYPTTARC